MKTALAILICLAIAPSAALAMTVMQDPSGDVSATTRTDQTTMIPAGARDIADLTQLDLAESETELTFTLYDAAYSQTAEPDGAFLSFGFNLKGTEFLVGYSIPSTTPLYPATGASLSHRLIGETTWEPAQQLETEFAAGSPGSFVAHVPRELLVDEFGNQPRAGDVLDAFWSSSVDHFSQGSLVSVVGPGLVAKITDAMPNTGTSDAAIELQLTPPTGKTVELSSPEPIRSSNGEQGTIVFQVFTSNYGPEAIDLSLSIVDAPSQWTTALARTSVRVPSETTVATPVIVGIPFGHSHGKFLGMNVSLSNQNGETLDRLQLGIKYLDIPQPAGHHNTLWLHTLLDDPALGVADLASGHTNPFMSTDEEDTRDTHGNLYSDHFGPIQAPTTFTWCIPLSPTLQIGLDFDLQGDLDFRANLQAGIPVTGNAQTRLLLSGSPTESGFGDQSTCTEDRSFLAIANFPSAPVSLQPGTPVDIAATTPPAADLVPYARGRELMLEVILTTDTPVSYRLADEPRIVAGGSLTLPLFEYHDPAPRVQVEGPTITTNTPPKLLRNPGTTAVFNFTIAGNEDDYQIQVLGLNNEWAQPIPATVKPDGTFSIQVRIPNDALDGILCDLIVKAVSKDNENLALARITVEVDQDIQHPNDATLSNANGAPSAGFGALSLTLLGLAIAASRTKPRT